MDIKDVKNEVFSGTGKKSFWGSAAHQLVFLGIGYLSGLARLPFGSSPFGFALLCSTRSCTLSALAGVILSSLGTTRAPIYIAAYLMTFVMRILISALTGMIKNGKKSVSIASFFEEPTYLCALNASLFAFLFSLYFFITGGYLLYDGYALAINTAVAPIAVILWRRFVLQSERFFPIVRSDWADLLYLFGLVSLSAIAARGAVDITLLGISLSALLAMTLTFAAVRYGSILQGALVGAFCGLAIDPLLAPSFVFGAVVFGSLSPISVFLGTLGAFAVSLWWGFYSTGLSALTSLLPAMLASSLIFTVLDGLFAPRKRSSEDESDKASDKPTDDKPDAKDILSNELISLRWDGAHRSLQRFSKGLGALSDELYSLSKVSDTDKKDVYGICESAFDSVCSSCTERDACRADCEFSEELGIIGGELRRGEMAQSSSVGEKLRSRCTRLPDILDEINYSATLWRGVEKEREQTEFFAFDYKMLSSLIASCETELGDVCISDNALAERISSALEGAAVAVLGKSRRSIIVSFKKDSLTDNEIRSSLLSVCGADFTLTEEREENGFTTLVYEQSPKISVSFDARSANAVGESEFCGDSYGVVQSEDGSRFISFISDGMGCGREASEASRTASAFLKNLIPISTDCEHTVRLLNSFLRRRGSDSLKECSVSIDLADIDLVTSRAVFCKSGAAPTYILRGDSVFKIRARTIPVGIISEVDIKRVELDLYVGDIVVMVSDGVTQGKEECPRLFELLKSTRSTDPKRICELVLKYALDSGGKDDISVLVLRMDNKNN